MQKERNAILGSFVGDSAALGTHWIYDQESALLLDKTKEVAFLKPSVLNYDPNKDYFAHEHQEAGDLSPSGEAAFVFLKSYIEDKGFIESNYLDAYVKTFGVGGSFHGYIDHATKDTLKNLQEGLSPSGANDFQSNGLHKSVVLAALVYKNENADTLFEQVLRTTQNNDIAVAYMYAAFKMLCYVLEGQTRFEAVERVIAEKKEVNAFSEEVYEALSQALSFSKSETDSIKAVYHYGQACGIKSVLLGALHAILNEKSFENAINVSIRAGGDSVSRTSFVGAVLAAELGIDNEGIPLQWLMHLNKNKELLALLKSFK